MRKVLFAALVAVAAMAFAASSASADPVEVIDETGTEPHHCPPVEEHGGEIEGGCESHIVNEAGEEVDLFHDGEEILDCNNEYEARVDENGEGYIYDFEFTGGFICSLIDPCDTHWHFNTEIDPVDNSVTVDIENACVDPPLIGECDGEIEIVTNPDQTEFMANEAPMGECAITGHWEDESGTPPFHAVPAA